MLSKPEYLCAKETKRWKQFAVSEDFRKEFRAGSVCVSLECFSKASVQRRKGKIKFRWS